MTIGNRELFISATNLDPNDASAWFKLGEVKCGQGKYLGQNKLS